MKKVLYVSDTQHAVFESDDEMYGAMHLLDCLPQCKGKEMLSSTRKPRLVDKPHYITYPLNTPVSEIEKYMEIGYSYQVDADNKVAVLSSPYADEDSIH